MDENERNLINPPIGIKDKLIELADSFGKAFKVVSFPTHLRVGWMKNILSFPGDFLVSFHADKVKEEDVFKTIERKRVILESYKMEEEQHRKVPSYKIDMARRSVEEFSNSIASANEAVFRVGIRTTVFGKNDKEIENSGIGISSRFGSVILHPLNYRQNKGFVSCVPIGIDGIEKTQLLSLRGIAGSLPVYIKEFQMQDGIVYGINPDTHSLVKINEWELPNPHIAILGPSGFGKTFFVKAIAARSFVFRNEREFIIDQQGEYELLTLYLGGNFIDRNDKTRINPFERKEDLRESVTEAKNFIILLLGQITQTEGALVEKALFAMYEKHDAPIFTHFIDELNTVGGQSLSVRLTPYYSGIYAPYFNGPTNVELRNRLTTFNYSRTPVSIRQYLVYLDFSFILKNAFDSRERTRLFIDEGWTMLSNSIGGEVVKKAMKTGRKYNLSVVFASQQLTDVIQTPAGKSVLEEPTIKFLTTQNETTLPVIQNVFMLNEEQALMLQRMGKGSGILVIGDERFPLTVIASDVEQVLFDTRPEKMQENLERWKTSATLLKK